MSTLRVSTIQDTAGSNSSTPSEIASGRAKAWVNFNGNGVVAIQAQYNVSSITDNGTGDYTVNFTTALADANYPVSGMANWDTLARGMALGINQTRTKTSSALPIVSFIHTTYALADTSEITVAIFR